jgi:hypothetical protein
MIRFRRSLLLALAAAPAALLAAACDDLPVEPEAAPSSTALASAPTHEIASAADLQAALADVSAGGHATIRLARNATIVLDQTVEYDGAADIHLRGRGATLVGPAGGDALRFTGAGGLHVDDLTVSGAFAHGIYVEVPANRTGTFDVRLTHVTLADNGFSGLWIDDQVHASPASLDVRIRDSRIVRNNWRGVGEGTDLAELADKDGVRVNEGGPGDLTFLVHNSWVEDNQADGIELDETGPGDVRSDVRHTSFVNNGAQEQFPDDLEDGFDIDEAGAGSIHARFVDVHVTGHQDEGIDLDESDAGSVYASMTRVTSVANQSDNISITESEEVDDDETLAGEGDIVVDFRSVDASERIANDDGDGIKLEEFGVGEVRGQIVRSRIANNDDDGLQVDEQGPGGGLLTLIKVLFEGNGDDDINSDVEVVILP